MHNSGDADAVVWLVRSGTDRVSRQIYVKRAATAVLRRVAVGEYVVGFEHGETYLRRSGGFCHTAGSFEFEKHVVFSEDDDQEATHYSDFEITLYTVADGNTRFHPARRTFRLLSDTTFQ